MNELKLTECPRDAMQGLHTFVPTEIKAGYINRILKCGFDTVDFGSFVSAKAIPQMRDTAAVLDLLDVESTGTKLLAIIANLRGAEEALQHAQINCLGFPFSISETFQQRNTNSSREQSFNTVKRIQELCLQKGKQLRVYLSMGFGNPYGDDWSVEILLNWASKIEALEINDIYLADTIGMSTAFQITEIFKSVTESGNKQIGLHLHSTPNAWFEKIDAAWQSGCRLFDTAIKGYGGCPMASDELTGNIATENLLSYFAEKSIETNINGNAFAEALAFAPQIFE